MASETSKKICVEVAYADAQNQLLVEVELPRGATVNEAIHTSGILQSLPNFTPSRLGIFGRIVAPSTVLAHGDRVELYRPLKADPKETRRRRASNN